VDFDAESGEFTMAQEDGTLLPRGKLGDLLGPLLKPETRVVVHGLQAESAKQWNEQVGKVLEYDGAAERYLVQVAPDAQLKVRPGNVRIFPLP